ncbi:hypothetical protein JGU71_25475 [Antrihabitans sp. YC3-6]|uniref:Hydrogenase maturation nickel metallochaperone HypA n=1 Tax=Antrihabitans stalagmiti TaxID=2799499 RepID=A0A934NW14_9NOCA|nr:DUF6510 family protein [Antrihabitans stalagmiti]MBJ8342247.1 hypothetical protein [Antrihabitans stalagmiti]
MTGPLDGNALAGVFRELFCADLTTAVGRCESCGNANALGTAQVYSTAPGIVVRCPGCDAVVMRVVRKEGRAWLDLRGVSYLQIDT